MAPAPAVTVIQGEKGRTVELPQGWGAPADDPALLVLTEGARLDARGRGDVYGVIVADGGDVSLDGTTLHGALFATGTVDFGVVGEVVFCRAILRRATDGSLVRTRLVPGTRQETIE